MAAILDGALWTVTEEIAEHMVETGFLRRCDSEHTGQVEPFDKPVYHISCDAPRWFGFATMAQAIAGAIKAVEEAKGHEEEIEQSG